MCQRAQISVCRGATSNIFWGFARCAHARTFPSSDEVPLTQLIDAPRRAGGIYVENITPPLRGKVPPMGGCNPITAQHQFFRGKAHL